MSDGLDVEADVDVSVFESNIRLLGGLLSAHLLATDPDLGLYPRSSREWIDGGGWAGMLLLLLLSVCFVVCFLLMFVFFLFERSCVCYVHLVGTYHMIQPSFFFVFLYPVLYLQNIL